MGRFHKAARPILALRVDLVWRANSPLSKVKPPSHALDRWCEISALCPVAGASRPRGLQFSASNRGNEDASLIRLIGRPAKHVGQALLPAAGAERLGLGALVGVPAGQGDHLEGGGQAAVAAEALDIDFRRARQGLPARESGSPGPDRVALAHPPEVAHQRQRVAVAHPDDVAVDHRQSEAGPLQQSAGVADVDERRDPRAGAAFDLDFRRHPGGPEFTQGVAAKQAAEEQPVGLQ